MRHEVEARHEEHHVDEEKPVFLQRYFSLGEEDFRGVGRFLADSLALEVRVGLGEGEPEEDEEEGGAGAEPEELGGS